MPLTDAQYKALDILDRHGPIRPREFARMMWPDSPGWKHHAKCGPYGSHRGGGMYTAGGGYLGRLNRKGWTSSMWGEDGKYLEGHVLTYVGILELADERGRRGDSDV